MSEPATPISEHGLKGETTTLEPDRQERLLARRSAESRATVPAADLHTVLDAGALLARERELGCGITAAVIAAAARALRAVPRLNGSYRDGRYELYGRVNVSVTAIHGDLHATPTILDADQKPASEIAGELADLYAQARAGELSPAQTAGSTFTVLDSSAYPLLALTPVIMPPHAGALGFGPLRETPVVRGGEVVAGHTMQLSLAVDHRIAHGHHAAAFLEEVRAFLEEARI